MKSRIVWTNGSVTISQVTVDKVQISSPGCGYCVIDGGDLQQVLEALITAYMAGRASAFRAGNEGVEDGKE